ncbi:Serine/threonine-protein kinase plo1 [Myxozyma melibiosi]|uniref:Serine/threonine-protein kinase n=1 Tax=Myxozyma melibiosi TaxID=54550 RepID=A0ABR1F4R2_9ASCO
MEVLEDQIMQDVQPPERVQAEAPPAEKPSSKPKEKPSSLCKTPPSLIRSKNNGAEFHRGMLLGEGGFARCFEVEDENGGVYAAKTVAKASLTSTKTRNKLLGEIKVHKSMDHPNIVKFVECFEDNQNVYILLEMCSNKTLMDMHRRRKRFTEPEARYFMIQILGAVKYMHSRRVIHRDLKLGNIFLDENMHVKIGDFGLAALLLSDNERKKTICGTPNYIAPEVLFGKQDGHSLEVDIWSVGIILYAMLCGKPPFQSKEVNMIYRKIKAHEYQFPDGVDISPEAKDLIQALLSKDPKARPSLDEIVDHPFFYKETPSYLPVTCLEGVPHWKNLTPSISRRNFHKLATAAGIGPGTQSASVGDPVTVKDVIQTAAPAVVDQSKLSNILPECLSPKVSNTNLRNIVTSTAQEKFSKASVRSARSLKPLSDLPINKSRGNEYPPLGRARRVTENDGSPPSKKAALSMRDSEARELGAIHQQRKEASLSPVDHLLEVLTNVNRALEGKPERESAWDGKLVYIGQWVDYSNKYGMGYQLSDGCSGVYFNDGATLVLDAEVRYLEYISDSSNPAARREQYPYTNMESLPADLKKKARLMNHFREYMLANLYISEQGTHRFTPGDQVSFLFDYARTKHATMFRLSSGEIQFNFTDHYKLILADRGKVVRFMDPSRNAIVMSTSQLVHRARKMKSHQQQGLSEGHEEKILDRMDFITTTLQSWYDLAKSRHQAQ